MLTLAALCLTVAGFGLFQALAERQPLAHLRQRDRRVGAGLRLLALGSLPLAAGMMAPARGWSEALLLELALLALAASAFVLLAAVAPRVTWRVTAAAPLLCGLLGFAAWRLA